MLLLGIIKELLLTKKSSLVASKIIEKKSLNVRLKIKSTLKQVYPTEKNLGSELAFVLSWSIDAIKSLKAY